MSTTQPTKERKPNSTQKSDQIDPSQIRVVEIDTGDEEIHKDCYDQGSEVGMFRLNGEELELRTVGWDQSKSMDPTVGLEWEETGLSKEEIEEIRIFSWPDWELVRIYKEME